MATLVITKTGFRFPYLKWARTSTPQNLQFLSALLEEYVHDHEDDGTTLWTVPQGFRMPKKLSQDEMETNMKYVEVQLEKHLHEHEITGGSGNELTFVREITLSPSFSNVGPAYGDGFLWEASATNPAKVYRVNISTGAATEVGTIPDSDDSDNGLTYFNDNVYTMSSGNVRVLDVSAGTWTNPFNLDSTIGFSLWSGLFHDGTNLWVHDWNNSLMYLVNPNTGAEVDSFSLSGSPLDGAIVNGITEIDGHMWFYGATLGIQIMNKSTRTFTDSIANPLPGNSEFGIASDGEFVWLTQQTDQLIHEYRLPTTSIVTTHVGFRFPYGWTTQSHTTANMRFLQEQVSQYLHKHEEGV